MADIYDKLIADGSPLSLEAANEIAKLQRENYMKQSTIDMFKDPVRLKEIMEIKKGLGL